VGANELWRVRTGRVQRLTVDARHAAAALSSFAHMTFADAARRPSMEYRRIAMRLIGIFAARQGRHIQLHPSFNDAARVLDVLGLPAEAERDDVERNVRERDAFELEQELVERGLCGGVVLSKDEWAAHPQGAAIADLPVVTITRIGDSPAEPFRAGDRPGSGVRVLDLTRVLAGPTCAKTIAEHGADVLHISAPNLERGGLFEAETGIGKRQAFVDLNADDGPSALRELVATADVFVQGYRKGALARRGFSPDDVAALRPGIVYVSENCYGPTGPWSERPGWEQLAQAATGMSYGEGLARGGPPELAPAAVNDYSTGFLAAYGAMVALARRATEGGSWHVEASLSQTSAWYLRLGDDNDMTSAEPGDVDSFRADMDTPDFGPIRYLRPALAMSETPPRWDLPPSLQGSHRAEWLPTP
jgi:hypothetical protein